MIDAQSFSANQPLANAAGKPHLHRRLAFEWPLLALLLFVGALYFGRATVVPIFGEEPRRGLIAREMLDTGDWITPRVQGIPRLSRPPLQNWLIAAASQLTGSVEVWAVRLPSLLATLLTVALIYCVGRHHLSREASFLAGFSYATMYNVLEYGRLGETEALFSLFVASSLLLWWLGRQQGWSSWLVWTAGYSCLALGLLTKGLQAPVYFVGSTWLFLIVTGRWRELLSRGHLIGLVLGGMLASSWQMAFLVQQGVEKSLEIYFWNVAGRFEETRLLKVLGHWAGYPFEVFLGALFPWTLFLVPYLAPNYWRALGRYRELALFLGLSAALCFVVVWLPPGSRSRYYMPLQPVLALLIGTVWQRLLEQTEAMPAVVKRWWRSVHRAEAGLVIAAIAGLILVGPQWLSPSVAWLTALALIPCVFLLITTQTHRKALLRGPLATGLVVAVLFAGPVLALTDQRCSQIQAAVAALKADLPEDQPFFSYGQLMHTFLFYYGEPIALKEWPDEQETPPSGVFCFHQTTDRQPILPFAWEQMGSVTCDRFQKAHPYDRIIIGRATSSIQQAHHSDQPEHGKRLLQNALHTDDSRTE